MVDSLTCVPPLAAVNQPWKVLPAHAGVGRAPTAAPFATVLVFGETVPPFASNVTVKFVFFQCA